MARWLPGGRVGAISAVLVAIAAWAALFPLDVLVRGLGTVRVENHNIRLQSQEGGVVTRMLVREGDRVNPGDLLAELDNRTVDEAFAKTTLGKAALEVMQRRLQSEVDDQALDFAGLDTTDPDIVAAIAQETATHQTRRSAQQEAEGVLREQVQQQSAEVRELRGQASDLSRELELQREQVALIEPLVKKGAAARGALLQKRSEMQRVQSALNQARGRIPRLEAANREAESRLRQVRADFTASAQQELRETQNQLAKLGAEVTANSSRKGSARVRATAAGHVFKVHAPHAGMVVKPGEDLVEIAPLDVPLVAEIRVRPEDRDRIWVGMNGRVRITAFVDAMGQTLPGQVTVISPDAITDPDGTRYYLVTLNVKAGAMQRRIHPGMGLEVYLETGRRTLLSYLLKPLVRARDVALSEP